MTIEARPATLQNDAAPILAMAAAVAPIAGLFFGIERTPQGLAVDWYVTVTVALGFGLGILLIGFGLGYVERRNHKRTVTALPMTDKTEPKRRQPARRPPTILRPYQDIEAAEAHEQAEQAEQELGEIQAWADELKRFAVDAAISTAVYRLQAKGWKRTSDQPRLWGDLETLGWAEKSPTNGRWALTMDAERIAARLDRPNRYWAKTRIR